MDSVASNSSAPFAAKIREVTPIHAANKVKTLNSGDTIFDMIITNKEHNHSVHSFFVKFLIGLLILIFLSYLRFCPVNSGYDIGSKIGISLQFMIILVSSLNIS